MRLLSCLTAGATVLSLAGGAVAQEADPRPISVELGVAGGYLIAGTVNPTGGVAIMPHVRVSCALPDVSWASVYYAQSPILVTPYSEEQIGVLDANDLGVAVHTRSRGVTVGVAATVAPSYVRWCNAAWCLRDYTTIVGAEAHVQALVAGAWGLHLLARALYAEPTAWTWDLPVGQREDSRWIFALHGGATWTY